MEIGSDVSWFVSVPIPVIAGTARGYSNIQTGPESRLGTEATLAASGPVKGKKLSPLSDVPLLSGRLATVVPETVRDKQSGDGSASCCCCPSNATNNQEPFENR